MHIDQSPHHSFVMRRHVFMAFLLAATAVFVFPLADRADAATCTSSGPAGGAYSVSVCITVPNAGAVVSGDTTVTATATITPSGATTVGKLLFQLDGAYLLTDFENPYTFTLPTTKFVDGTKQIGVSAELRDGFISPFTTISTTFANNITVPPVNTNTRPPTSGTTPAPGQPFVFSAAGDGASGRTQADDVISVIDSFQPNLFAYLGDVYDKGTSTEFRNWYGKAGSRWDKFRSITNPVVGNHEYVSGVAPGYFDYWDNVDPYYSYDAQGWHFIALNSNPELGQTTPGTGQYDWLAADLAANTAACTVAYFHHPVLNIGPEGASASMDGIFKLLADNGVDIALTGHDHNYQRWVPVDGNKQPSATGMTEFVLGASGQGVRPFATTDSRVAAGFDTVPNALGAPRFELNPQGAAFIYKNTAGQILDSGVLPCNGAGSDTQAPTTPGGFSATAVAGPAVALAWTRSTDNVGVSNYRVYRDNVEIAQVAGHLTSYTDSAVQPLTSYQYRVDAIDPAGNASPKAGPANVTTLNHPASVTTVAGADTYVDANFPTTNYGSSSLLRVDNTPDQRSYLKFNVTGVVGPVSSATLRVKANSTHSAGFTVQDVGDDSWSESTMTYNAGAPFFGPAVGNSGPLTSGNYVDIPVSAVVNGNGTYSFALTALNGTALNVASRETATPPQLVIAQDVTGNQPPVAAPVSLNTVQDVGGYGALWFPSVSDPDSTTLTCSIATQPSNGVAGVVPDCSLGLYSPARGFHGVDTFTYRVSDGSLSATATVTATVAESPTRSYSAAADTYVSSSAPTTNYGSSGVLRGDTSPDKRSYLKFDVTGLSGPVVSATLKLTPSSNHAVGFALQNVGSSSWSESTMTYNSGAPAFGPQLGTSGPLTKNATVEIPVTAVVNGNGTYSFAITPFNSTALGVWSREAYYFGPPQLVVVQDLTGNQAPTANDVSASTDQDVAVAWTPSVSDPDSASLSCTIDTQPSSGAATVANDCSTGSYQPSPGSFGSDTFTYRVSDGSLSDIGTVTVDVAEVAQSSVTVLASADTYVSSQQSTKNYGSSRALRVDASPDQRTYVRFQVSGLVGPVLSATLRVHAGSAHSVGFALQDVTDDSWSESTMTYDSGAPAFGPFIANSGPLSAAAYVDIPVTLIVNGNGTYSFALTSRSSASLKVDSRETSFAPQLVIVQDLG